jgi:hypothetical protein
VDAGFTQGMHRRLHFVRYPGEVAIDRSVLRVTSKCCPGDDAHRGINRRTVHGGFALKANFGTPFFTSGYARVFD